MVCQSLASGEKKNEKIAQNVVCRKVLPTCKSFTKYSRTSIARAPMARLPWLIQTSF